MAEDIPYMPIKEFEESNLRQAVIEKLTEQTGGNQPVPVRRRKKHLGDRDTYSYYVDCILEGMGMVKYAPLFQAEDIGVDVLVQLNSDDLIALGITDDNDRNCILKNLKDFNTGNQKHEWDCESIKGEEDDFVMMRNMYNHLVHINSHLSFVNLLISRSSEMEDYFVTTRETALNVLKLVTRQALTQTYKLSDIIYNEKPEKNSLVHVTSKVVKRDLSNCIKRHTKKKIIYKFKKKRICFIATIIIAAVVAYKWKK